MRIILAGLFGAVVMFVWISIAHIATPLAYAGISKIGDEKRVLDAFKTGIGSRPGLYFFPWTDPKDPNAMKKSAELVKTEPTGILIYTPPGTHMTMTPYLIKEFGKEFLQCLIAAFLLSVTGLTAYAARVGFVGLLGVLAALGTDTSYWIWYGFPLSYTLAQIAMPLIGLLFAALVIAAMIKPRPA